MSNVYYVYAYLRKSNLTPYYIGKGKNGRAFSGHVYINLPGDPSRIVFLERNLTELGAFALERRYIRWYGRRDTSTGILLNRADGGEGASGYRMTDETKAKIAAAQTGKTRSHTTRLRMATAKRGRTVSEETREIMRAQRIGKKMGPMSQEARLNISISKLGHPVSAETREKIRKSNLGKTPWNLGQSGQQHHQQRFRRIEY